MERSVELKDVFLARAKKYEIGSDENSDDHLMIDLRPNKKEISVPSSHLSSNSDYEYSSKHLKPFKNSK